MTFAGKVHDVSDIRQAGNTKVCTVRIYQSYPKKKSDDGSVSEWGSDWVSVTAFGAAAEVCQTLEKKQEITLETIHRTFRRTSPGFVCKLLLKCVVTSHSY